VIEDTGQVKEGTASACVARQYSGTMGNCQVAVSVDGVTDKASAPLDWLLFMPKSRDDEAADGAEAAEKIRVRRQACKIPAGKHHRPKWQMAIEMLDELAEWGYRPPVVAADAGYGDTTAFRLALQERNISYVVAVKGSTSAQATEWARVVAEQVENAMPALVVSKMTKALRRNKALIDWSQNNPKRTTVAPYSLRGRPEPLVAAPRTWAELTAPAWPT